MAFVFSIVVFFIDHYCAGVSNKHCLLSFFIAFIKLVDENQLDARQSLASYFFPNSFNKFNNTSSRALEGKSCSFGLPCVPFVNCCQFMYLVISRLGFGRQDVIVLEGLC